jgi:pimeloyl-ACP methyl ester carboxylesterase
MSKLQRSIRPLAISTAIVVVSLLGVVGGLGDTVILNNGIIYRGIVDRDKPILWIYDGVKRVVVRDSKVKKIESDASFRSLETFDIDQPLVVHGGAMPKEILSVKAEPWNDRGRRTFSYEGSRIGKFIRMEQAINKLGPHLAKIRGVDGYWQSQLETNQIPRETVIAILSKVEQTDKNERLRVARFLVQAEWFSEARAELDRILKDFPNDPNIRESVAITRASVAQLDALRIRTAIDRCRSAQQPKELLNLLKTFPTQDVSNDLLVQVRDLLQVEEDQAAADKSLADDLRALSEKLPAETQTSWKSPMLEALKALKEAPDAVRDRFVAWQKVKGEGLKSPEAMFALAMSGYVVGAEAAVEDLALARTYWTMRDEMLQYLAEREGPTRSDLLSKLDAATFPSDPETPDPIRRLETATRLALLMPPPFHEPDDPKSSGGLKIRRVREDHADNEPSDYAVFLPPEYHPLRSYPAVVALHDGHGPKSAIEWWSAEAAKRGYIVIAPEYKLPGQGAEYNYSTSEHAAVELALRDARRRYAIDSDRVFIGGQLVGANMAWDFGLAHPDLCAGVVVVSGLPFKYVNRYLPHVDLVPLFVVEGDLAPAANEVVFGQLLKPLIATRAWDVTYVEYLKRGMESFPEEAASVFEWMDRRHREPFPKAFSVVTARDSDQRFYGIVIRDFRAGRTTAPEAVEPMGKNLNPASIKLTTSRPSNLMNLTVDGIRSFDVWVSPKLIDFKRKMEIRVNNRKPSAFKAMPRPDLGQMLEDLRLRGDRQQIYWMKVPIG